MRVGVFDSGVGGLSVVKSLIQHSMFEEIIYFGDTARVPYGIKDKNTIVRYSLEALEFFKNFNIDILITACNTVSAYALTELKNASNIEVVGVIEAGILAVKQKNIDLKSNILILGTKATISSRKYEILLNREGYFNLTSISPSLFIPIVEEGLFGSKIMEESMKHYFKGVKNPDAIILGCTHFPLIAKDIKSYYPNATIIHSGEAIVKYLKKNLKIGGEAKESKLRLFASENPDNLKKIASLWLNN